MHRHPASRADAPVLVLAHGAGAGQQHPWMRRVAQGLAARGVSVVTFDFPYRQAGRRIPDRAGVLEDAFGAVWRDVVASRPHDRVRLFASGKSMGGRIASQCAAGGGLVPAPAGLVFFGYPLHPPGKPDQRRDRHLPGVEVPMLFLHGARDAFGSPAELQALTSSLPRATLHVVDAADHSLLAPKRVDPSGRSLELALDAAARWVRAEPV